MKKFIVSGMCTTVVCFLLSSFAPNSNNVAGAVNGISENSISTSYQDTTHKKMKKMERSKSDTSTTKTRRMSKVKKPA
ncbi:MAG: hypothetical protein ABIN89_00080 [Chitinophagaceae bacterium]